MTDGIGYLLPEGDAYTDDLGCTIVFYPNKDEYRRALLGSLHYLATWVAWERDAAKRGKDAARAWKNANDETMECWQMSCLDGLIADVAAIKAMLASMSYCCDGSITYGDQIVVDPPFVPGAGDPPDTYGETPISDWDEWQDYVCYNANAYVDDLIETANQFAQIASISGWSLAFVAAGLALISFTGIGLPISFALAATVLAGLFNASSGPFDEAADDIEAARNEIVCSIISGGDLENAVSGAIGVGSAAWTLLFSHADYGSAASIIQSGGYGDEYLPAQTDTGCDCIGESVHHGQYGTGATCATFTESGRIPTAEEARYNVWYANVGYCTDLAAQGAVSRVRFISSDGVTKSSRYVRIRVDNWSINGMHLPSYPNAVATYDTGGTLIAVIPANTFVSGQVYDLGVVHRIDVVGGESSVFTFNWQMYLG